MRHCKFVRSGDESVLPLGAGEMYELATNDKKVKTQKPTWDRWGIKKLSRSALFATGALWSDLF